MKYVHPEINCIFDSDNNTVNTIVIENQSFFTSVITDIRNQIDGKSGNSVISKNDKPILFEKYAEILDRFVPFEINRKNLISKIISEVEKEALSPEHYEETMSLLSNLECYLYNLSLDMDCCIDNTKLSISSIIKASAPEIRDDYDSLGEKILDYMEIVRRFEKDKIFFFVNLRSYINDKDMELFMESAISHGFNVIMIDNKEYKRCDYEKRLIIDENLCEII